MIPPMMSVADPPNKPAQQQPPVVAATAKPQNLLARNLLTLLVFALGFSPLALTAPAKDQNLSTITPVNSRELPNFHVVHSYFYRGGAPSFTGMEELQRMGVKTIIDLRKTPIMIEAERSYVEKLGMEYISIPMGDAVPSAEKQKLFLSVLSRASNDPSAGPVFLHCSHGSDRTGYLTALWRVQHDHWTILQAGVEMLQRGFFIHKFEANPASRIDT